MVLIPRGILNSQSKMVIDILGERPKIVKLRILTVNIAREVCVSNLGFPLKTLCQYMRITHRKARGYVEDLLAKFEDDKNSVMMRLDLLGWTQDEISAKLQELWPDAKGTSQDEVSRSLRKNGDDNFCVNILDDLAKGHSVETVAKRHALPPILIWAIKLKDLSDQAKLDELKIKIQPYDVWNFHSCHDLFGSSHPGRIPGELVAHALLALTNPGDLVIDPMVGSGTTIDVCLAMGRRCYGYDIDQRHGRNDVITHDMATGCVEQ